MPFGTYGNRCIKSAIVVTDVIHVLVNACDVQPDEVVYYVSKVVRLECGVKSV